MVKKMTNILESKITDKKYLKEITNKLNERYGIPADFSFSYITLQNEFIDLNESMLFWFAEIILGKEISNYYFKDEINGYSKLKFQSNTIEFPLRIPMIQIKHNQWIGKITAKQLIKLRDAHMINYNKNAQRTMQHVVKGDIEYYRITLNKNAVKKMEELYDSGSFIPNTITLNIPVNDSEFEYDERNKELIIKKLEYFDIIDGYHRYIAISNLSNFQDFDYEMELRITNFDDNRSQQMIWQEDQKTKMSKVNSESYNHDLYCNRIVDYLNDSNVLRGKIKRYNGIIDPALLSNAINGIYFKKLTKKDADKTWMMIRSDIENKFNKLIEENPELITTDKWTYPFILAVVFSFKNDVTSYSEIKQLYKKMSDDDYRELFTNTAHQMINKQAKKLEAIWERG